MRRVLSVSLMVLVFTLLVTILSPPAVQANPATAAGVWREWSPDYVNRTGMRGMREPAAADLQKLFDSLSEIAELFRETRTLAGPVGFDVKGSRRIDLRPPRWAAGREVPARALLSLYLYPYTTQRDGSARASDIEWTGFIGVYVNEPNPFELLGGGMRSLDEETWYLEPKPIRTVGGYTMYEAVADDRVMRRGPQRFAVVAPAGFPPLWLPVSVEEYADDIIRRWEAQLAQMQERLAQFQLPRQSEAHRRAREATIQSMTQLMEMQPQMAEQLQAQLDEALRQFDAAAGDPSESDRRDAAYEQRMREAAQKQQAELEASINAMRAELAALSPAERRAQAVGKLHLHRPGAQTEGEIVPLAVPGGSEPRGLVRVNRDLFSNSASRTTPQLFLVNFHTNREFMAERFSEIERQLDWGALARVIE